MLDHGAHCQLAFIPDPEGSPVCSGVETNLWPDEVIANRERAGARQGIVEIDHPRQAECRLESPGGQSADGGREPFAESRVAQPKHDIEDRKICKERNPHSEVYVPAVDCRKS